MLSEVVPFLGSQLWGWVTWRGVCVVDQRWGSVLSPLILMQDLPSSSKVSQTKAVKDPHEDSD